MGSAQVLIHGDTRHRHWFCCSSGLQVPRRAWPGLLRMPDIAGSAGSPEAVEAFVALVRR